MNCSQIEKSLPLYITADLAVHQSAIVAAHLTNCLDCQAKAEAFSASQNWLQNLAVPEFSASEFAQIRANVCAQIETAEAQKVSPFWFGWQLKVGLTATALFIVAGIAFFITDQSPRKIAEVAKEIPAMHTPQRQAVTARGTVLSAVATGSTSRVYRTKPAKLIKLPVASSPIKSETIAPATNIKVNDVAVTNVTPVLQTAAEQPQTEAPEMLRIEIQTADPNITIIWLTPKETMAMRTNVATDSK